MREGGPIRHRLLWGWNQQGHISVLHLGCTPCLWLYRSRLGSHEGGMVAMVLLDDTHQQVNQFFIFFFSILFFGHISYVFLGLSIVWSVTVLRYSSNCMLRNWLFTLAWNIHSFSTDNEVCVPSGKCTHFYLKTVRGMSLFFYYYFSPDFFLQMQML